MVGSHNFRICLNKFRVVNVKTQAIFDLLIANHLCTRWRREAKQQKTPSFFFIAMMCDRKNLVGLSSKAVKCESPKRRLELVGPAPLTTVSLNTPSVTVESDRVSVSSPSARHCAFALLSPDEGLSSIRAQDHSHDTHDNQPAPTRQVCGGEDGVTCAIADLDVSSTEDKGVVRKRLYISTLPRVRYIYHHVDGRVTRHKSLSGFEPLMSTLAGDPEVQSLNGSHGEVTEDDDMASSTVQQKNDERKRMFKEAQSHTLSSIPGNGHKGMRKSNYSAANRRVKSQAESCCSSILTDILDSIDTRPSPSIAIVSHQVQSGAIPYFVYLDWSSGKCKLRLALDNPDFAYVHPNDILHNVISERVGYYELDKHGTKGLMVHAASPFQMEKLASYKLNDGHTDKREGIIFMPLYSSLRDEFRNSAEYGPLATSYLTAIKNVTARCKMAVSESLPRAVVTWYDEVCEFTELVFRVKVAESHSKNNPTNNLFLARKVPEHTTVVCRTGTVNIVNVVDMPPPEGGGLHVYELKPNIRISRKGVVKPLNNHTWFEEPQFSDLQYTPDTVDVRKEGRATSEWCRLTSVVRYGGSAWNLYHAISRIIKARTGERDYQKAQAGLCLALARSFGNFDLWAKMGVVIVDVSPEITTFDAEYMMTKIVRPAVQHVIRYPYLTELTEQDRLDIYELSLQHDYLITVFSKLHTLMKPTFGEFVFDLAHNTVIATKQKAYTIFMSIQAPLIMRAQYVEEPHAKKFERTQMLAGVLGESGCFVDSIGGHVKDENAKFGKAPRLFASYGSGVLCAPGQATVWKSRMNGWHVFDIGRIHVTFIVYTTPKSSELIKLFDELVIVRRRRGDNLCVAIFSDDSCYSGVVDGIPFGYNVDISSCDSSNGAPIFFMVGSMMSLIDWNYARLLIEQCTKPINIKHPTDKEQSFSLLMPGPMEGSGTVLTTALNTSASIAIGVSVAQFLDRRQILSVDAVESCIIDGASSVGHKVTVATIEVGGSLEPARFQFLKTSPMVCRHKETGERKLLPVKNLGSIIKGFGLLFESMQANQIGLDTSTFKMMTWATRFDVYFGAVIKGYCNEPDTPLLNALRTRFINKTGVLKQSYQHVESDIDFSQWEVEPSQLEARYGFSDMDSVVEKLLDLQLGDHLQADPLLKKIMQVDYEFAPQEVSLPFDS